jgi:hypothetical protein
MVTLKYRGIDAASAAAMEDVGPQTAFIATDAPLPVGTALELSTPGGDKLGVEVIRVFEKVGTADRRVGVRVRAQSLQGAGAEFWQALVTGVDPEIPECVEPLGEPVDSSRPTEVMAAVTEEEIAVAGAEPSKAKKKKKKKR